MYSVGILFEYVENTADSQEAANAWYDLCLDLEHQEEVQGE